MLKDANNAKQINYLFFNAVGPINQFPPDYYPAGTPIIIAKRYGIREDPWCSPTLTGILSVNPTLL